MIFLIWDYFHSNLNKWHHLFKITPIISKKSIMLIKIILMSFIMIHIVIIDILIFRILVILMNILITWIRSKSLNNSIQSLQKSTLNFSRIKFNIKLYNNHHQHSHRRSNSTIFLQFLLKYFDIFVHFDRIIIRPAMFMNKS